ncbi:hypothetical protein [Arthrobacter sp. MA-N2]|uniref:hypothetical protein n=1 Tax=Arthrobacter sp. MA-N2 TaxID=1101188 RepID=UPI0004819BC3|nr:hypothetical protein [Arthrobacter sp. MA-N2]
MSQPAPYKARRTAKADPRLGQQGLFNPQINRNLLDALPEDARESHFTRATMPPHWLDAILENQPSYRQREKSVALDFRDLPGSMVTEFAWSIERQVQLGLRIQAECTSKMTRQIARVIGESQYSHVVSLLQLSRDQWIRAIQKVRSQQGDPLAAQQLIYIGRALGRTLDLLVHAYHEGEWWELNVWNPELDTRIPLREHEPKRRNLVYFSHLTTPWLQQAAKWWLSRQLEREVYTWSTVQARQHGLVWFQRYLDLEGFDGPHILNDQRKLGTWVQGFRQWLNQQKASTGPNKGNTLGAVHRRAAMTAPEQLVSLKYPLLRWGGRRLRWPWEGPGWCRFSAGRHGSRKRSLPPACLPSRPD